MPETNTARCKKLIGDQITPEEKDWLEENIEQIIGELDVSKLYLTYSLIASKIKAQTLKFGPNVDELSAYLEKQGADTCQLARIYLLAAVLDKNFEFFSPKAAQIIQVADRGEIITFLKFLILLPQPDYFKSVAVEALRTNITPVFEAIALNNPYPSTYFDQQQWNQMYLKAAFMQLNLTEILDVDKRANAELARIISDYAHERWAASREIDPVIWRPATKYLNDVLITDMKRLLQSENPAENKAGALCCYHSQVSEAKELLKTGYPKLHLAVTKEKFDWNQINV